MENFFNHKEKLFDISLNSIKIGIIILDKDSCIRFINKAARDILGIDENSNRLYLSDIAYNAWQEIKEIFITKKEQIGKREKIKGKTLFVQRYPILYRDRVIGVISFFQHFSEMEKLAKELESYHMVVNELNTIIESIYDGIFVTDGAGKTIRVNSSWAKITGLKPEYVLGKTVTELEKKGYVSKFVTPMVIQDKKPMSLQAKTVTGKEVLVSGNPVLDRDGNVSMVVTTVRDLSEMRQLSRELKEARKLAKEYEYKIKELKKQIINFPSNIVCESKAMEKVLDIVVQLQHTKVPVLIYGETGVGKGVIAKLIHKASFPKLDAPFVCINCSAIPESLLEAELFGYEKGAFTGADVGGKPGLFELADGGTLVLDEIGELPLYLQAKLLAVLEDYKIQRIGGTKPKKVNIRIICITNRDLKEMVSKGEFREDLFFRINVVPILIPPLRERKEDILPLIHYFLKEFNQKYKMNKSFSRKVIELLYNYHWPGNVRELRNLIERLMIMSQNNLIDENDLPNDIFSHKEPYNNPKKFYSLKEMVKSYEISVIQSAVEKYGSIAKASEKLQVSPSTLYRKLQKI